MTATLYIVATPIGNLEDITFRALRILKEVDLIAAEDTRHSLKLLNHFGISRPMTSYFDHNQHFKGERILEHLRSGKSVALISDAGTPGIADPGYRLVRDALDEGIPVVPIPGANAAIAALSVGGLPTDQFTFAGFPPPRQGKRRTFLAQLQQLPGTLVIYEAPHRLPATLEDIRTVMGERQLVIARELTKLYEELSRGTVSQVLAALPEGKLRGEVVILIGASGEDIPTTDTSEQQNIIKQLAVDGDLPPKQAAREIAKITHGSVKEAYHLVMQARIHGKSP